MMSKGKRDIIVLTVLMMLAIASAGCSRPHTGSGNCEGTPHIYPDYTDIEIPANIAPMNFRIEEPAQRYLTTITAGGKSISIHGKTVRIPARKWRKLLHKADSLAFSISTYTNGEWRSFTPFSMRTTDSIDRYVSYRLIPPSFQQYEEISLAQRDLSSFHEKTFYSNTLVQRPPKGLGQCVNCHSFQNYKTDNMQFHTRQYKGGTVLVTDGKPRITDIRADNGISAGVYPAWHPTLPLIAYSTNNTQQSFHTASPNHIEVFDVESNLILYDVESGGISTIQDAPDQMECFPTWSPDGTMLYYVSARIGHEIMEGGDIAALYNTIRYDLYSKTFNPATREWGPAQLLYQASADSASVTLPRVSPDGRYLMMAKGSYGVFQIWHNDADLWMMSLCDSTMRPLSELNSNYSESYHSWSHDGRWILFSSRREDGAFTRMYLSHLQPDGTFSKPFTIPQRNPLSNTLRLCSYNVPELTTEPVRISARRFARIVKRGK